MNRHLSVSLAAAAALAIAPAAATGSSPLKSGPAVRVGPSGPPTYVPTQPPPRGEKKPRDEARPAPASPAGGVRVKGPFLVQ